MLCRKCAPSHPRAGYSPATRKSWLHGLGAADEPGKVFFRKDFENSEPDWIPRLTLTFEDHINTYPMIDEPAGLAWFDQVAALEVQAPNEALDWTATRQPGPVGPRSGRRCRPPWVHPHCAAVPSDVFRHNLRCQVLGHPSHERPTRPAGTAERVAVDLGRDRAGKAA